MCSFLNTKYLKGGPRNKYEAPHYEAAKNAENSRNKSLSASPEDQEKLSEHLRECINGLLFVCRANHNGSDRQAVMDVYGDPDAVMRRAFSIE